MIYKTKTAVPCFAGQPFPYIAFDFCIQMWYTFIRINLDGASLFGGGFFVSKVRGE